MFNGVLLTYDYPKHEIRVRKGSISEAELAHPGVVSTSKGARPFIRAAIDGNAYTLLLDRFAFAEPPRPTGVEVRINGLLYVQTGRLENDLELGPLILRRALVNKSVSVNLVGQRIMRAFVITFDQINHRVRFANPHGSLDEPIEFHSL